MREAPALLETATLALEAAALGTWSLDLATRTLTASPRCKAQHGLPPDAPLQLEHMVAEIHQRHRPQFLAELDRAIEGQGLLHVDVPIRWADGSDHWLRVRGRVIDAARMVGVSQDVTVERQAEEALRDADHRKDEILTLVAHELRGPLGAIVNAVRVLELQGPRTPVLQEARAVIRRQTGQLNKLVEDLLDVGRIAAGKLHLRRRRVELGSLIQQAVETCAPLLESRSHTLALETPLASVFVEVDPARIIQVLCNLLNNAAKYMPDGGQITLTASSDATAARIAVRDRGIGIPPSMLERVFDRYVQVRSAEYRSSGGLGVGLSIAKMTVEMHGGTLEAFSEGPGTGAEFVVRLPVAPARRPASPDAERQKRSLPPP